MLVLSRREGEAIQIGPDIIVTVEQVRGRYVRLGFIAPKELSIRRTELVSVEKPSEGKKP